MTAQQIEDAKLAVLLMPEPSDNHARAAEWWAEAARANRAKGDRAAAARAWESARYCAHCARLVRRLEAEGIDMGATG